MKFKEKKTAYNDLLGIAFLDADAKLLKKIAPGTPMLKTGILNIHKKHRAILWKLLDVATVDEIFDNRKQNNKLVIDSDFPTQLKKLIDRDPSTVEGIINLQKEIKALVSKIDSKNLSDEYRECIDAKEGKLNIALINNVQKQALTIDLNNSTQRELAFIARTLNLKTPDYTAKTLKGIIKKLRAEPGIYKKEMKGVVDDTAGEESKATLPDIKDSGKNEHQSPEKKNPE